MYKKFSTTCSYCGVGCGIDLTVSSDEEIIDFKGTECHPVNQGALCSKGANLHYVVKDKSDRLLVPKARFAKSYPLEEITWEHAIARGTKVFKHMIEKYGNDSVGLYVSGQMLTEEYYLANKLCKGFLGTNNIDTNSRLCMSSAVVGYKKSIGDDAPPISYDDIEHCDCFFIAGANPAWCHPILFRRIEAQLKKNNICLIVVDPRETQTAQMADVHLKIIPGTDIILYNAIASLLFKYNYCDEVFLKDYANCVEELRDYLYVIDVVESAKQCGLELADIEKVVKMIGESKTLLTMWAMGLNQSSIGVDKNLALINLNIITGRIGKKGSGPFSLTGQPNAMGGREVGGLANLLAAHHDLDNPEHCKKVADFWGIEKINSVPGLSATEMIDAINEGKLKALWIICTNPAVSLPRLGKVKEALKKIPFLVVSDISEESDTLKYADLIFPAAGWLEKEGTMTNSERRITYLPKVISPPGQALPDTEILCRFARALGYEKQFTYNTVEDIFNEHKNLTKGTNIDITGVTYQRLKENSIQWPCSDEKSQGTNRLFTDYKFFTKNKKVNLSVVRHQESQEKISEDYPFILTTGRLRDQWHTMTRTGKVKKLKMHAPRPLLEIHPYDAKKLDIDKKDMVKVFNKRGSVELMVDITDTIRQGTVFLPMHWQSSFNRGRNCTNILTSDLIDPISKEPEFKLSAVNISKIVQKKKKIIIIGAGAAALEFIQCYRKRNKEDELVIFGRENYDFYNRILLPEYLDGKSEWVDISYSLQEEFIKQKIIFNKGVNIESIDKANKYIVTSQGDVTFYDKLIIATGSFPIIPKIEKIKSLSGVFTLRSRTDADNISDYVKNSSSAVIVGGGLLGLELAASLANLNIKVTIVQRSSRLMRAQIDEIGGRILHKEIIARGIDVIYFSEIVEVLGKEKIESVILANGDVIKCDSLFFAIGVKPNMSIAQKAGLDCSRGIIVNDFMQTSDESIYAIGEVIEHRGNMYGTTSAAQEQASLLGNVLLGDFSQRYLGSVNFNILKIHNLKLCSLGLIRRLDDSYEEIQVVDEKLCYYKKCFVKGDYLYGAILIGDNSEFSEFKNLIENKYELGERRNTLFRGTNPQKEKVLGKLICVCNDVGEGNIVNVIEKGCHNFEDLCVRANVGNGCGSCRPEVQKILDTVIEKKICIE